jgi:hypothetical protein
MVGTVKGHPESKTFPAFFPELFELLAHFSNLHSLLDVCV